MIHLLKNQIRKYKVQKLYASFIHSEQLCFDIGANKGEKSKVFLSLGAKVIGFEPQVSCIPILQKIIKDHPRFTYHQIAVGEQNEKKELFLGTHTEIATLSHKFMDYFKDDTIFWPEKEIVIVKTLDTLIQEFGLPDYCKIDVEGHEEAIFKSLTHTIPIIEFEFTGGFIDETVRILKKLTSLGNYQFNYISNERPYFKLKSWVSQEEIARIVISLPKRRLHGNIFAKLISE